MRSSIDWLRSKLLHAEVAKKHAARFEREAQALAKLSHPNVIQVYEVGEANGQTFIAMELVRGQTLRAWREESKEPRTWRECVNVYLQAGAGLAAAHDAGLVHRDFKPDNVIIDDKDHVRVLDFGMARRIVEPQTVHEDDRIVGLDTEGTALEASLTQSGAILGTPYYMSPEQWRGEEVGPHSDQFSFCVALHEALYGERPFGLETIYEVMGSSAKARIQPPDVKKAASPSQLRHMVLRGLAHDPRERWPSMNALLAELRGLVAPRSRRFIARGLAVGLVAMAGSGAVAYYLEVKERCTGAQAQLHGIWDDARRQQVQDAVLGTGLSYASDTWERIEPRLEDYAAVWVDKHTEVCEATSVRGEQTGEAMDLRMGCLRERKVALNAAVKVLAAADDTVVEKATSLVETLPSLDRCDDLARLQRMHQRVPPPEDPRVAQEVEALREQLASIGAEYKAGKYAYVLEHIEPVVQRAKALRYGPLLAESLVQRALAYDNRDELTEAEQDLEQAFTIAAEHGYDALATDAVSYSRLDGWCSSGAQ